jgi:hypothetical protein
MEIKMSQAELQQAGDRALEVTRKEKQAARTWNKQMQL